jgi:hypothetical protein
MPITLAHAAAVTPSVRHEARTGGRTGIDNPAGAAE